MELFNLRYSLSNLLLKKVLYPKEQDSNNSDWGGTPLFGILKLVSFGDSAFCKGFTFERVRDVQYHRIQRLS